ncbi:MAG: hypothetical protein ABFD44_08040 [Anaerolineaceae bacterium]
MMESKKLTVEDGLILTAFVLGLAFRLANLGGTALLSPEADEALKALALAQGKVESLGADPGYMMGTGLLFYLFGGTNFLARFLPALLGSLLILSPLLVRKSLGRIPSLLLMFGLAIDPGLTAVSRTAGAVMMALSLSILALGFWQAHKPAASGITLGLALLCGSSFWVGGFSFLLAAVIFWLVQPRKRHTQEDDEESIQAPTALLEAYTPVEIRRFLIFAAGTFLLAGSGLLLVMRGWGAAISGLISFWQGWAAEETVSGGRLLGTLVLYEIFPLILAGVSLFNAIRKHKPLPIFLGVWFLVSTLMVWLYPARTVSLLVWSLVPLWGLAVHAPARWLDAGVSDRKALAAQTALIFIVILYAWQNVLGLVNVEEASQLQLRYLSLGAALALLVLATLLVGWGWKPQVARLGLAAGGSLALLLYTVSVLFGAAGLRGEVTAELWQPEIRGESWTLLEKTVSELSLWKLGDSNSLALTVVGKSDPAMVWLLRNHLYVTYTESLPLDNQAAIIITNDQTRGQLESAYRGQRFVAREWLDRGSVLSGDVLPYALYRRATLQQEGLILWARADIFPSSRVTGTTQN